MGRDSQLIFEAWSDMSRRTFLDILGKGVAALSQSASLLSTKEANITPAGHDPNNPWLQVTLDGNMGVIDIDDLHASTIAGKSVWQNVASKCHDVSPERRQVCSGMKLSDGVPITDDMYIDYDHSDLFGYTFYVKKDSPTGQMFGTTEAGDILGMHNGFFEDMNRQIMFATRRNSDWIEHKAREAMELGHSPEELQKLKGVYQKMTGKKAPGDTDKGIKAYRDEDAALDAIKNQDNEAVDRKSKREQERFTKRDVQKKKYKLKDKTHLASPGLQKLNPYSSPTGQGTYADLRDSFCRNRDNQLIYEQYLAESPGEFNFNGLDVIEGWENGDHGGRFIPFVNFIMIGDILLAGTSDHNVFLTPEMFYNDRVVASSKSHAQGESHESTTAYLRDLGIYIEPETPDMSSIAYIMHRTIGQAIPGSDHTDIAGMVGTLNKKTLNMLKRGVNYIPNAMIENMLYGRIFPDLSIATFWTPQKVATPHLEIFDRLLNQLEVSVEYYQFGDFPDDKFVTKDKIDQAPNQQKSMNTLKQQLQQHMAAAQSTDYKKDIQQGSPGSHQYQQRASRSGINTPAEFKSKIQTSESFCRDKDSQLIYEAYADPKTIDDVERSIRRDMEL